MTNRLMFGPVCLALALSFVRPLPAPAAEPASTELFARKNLVAWCIVPFDSKKRGPEERAAMLEKLGFSRFAYDYRAEHIPTFDQEIECLKRHKVELTAWWFPTSLNDEAKLTLAVFEKHKVTPQLWVTGGGGPTKDEADQRARVVAEAARIRPIVEAAAKVGCKVALYNHGGWFGEPENQIAIIQELKHANVGIVYNQHHGHDHLDRFAELLQKMKPHLYCLNLNGMTGEGDRKGQKIMQLGEGDLDLKLLKVVKESGYTGPIGILGHTQDDAEERLHDNLDGFDWLLPQLDGKPAGPKPKMRTPMPNAQAPPHPSPLPPKAGGEGTKPLADGKFGKALDGRSGGALVKGRDEFRQFPLTVECWTKLAHKESYNILVAHELKSSGTHWELFSMPGGAFTAYLPGFAPDHCNSTALICDDKWHHVAMVLELERVRLYVDGKQVADQKHHRSAQATVPGDVGLATLVERAIGCTGLVDEVRISKGVREINASPNKPFIPDDATLGLWHLDELLEQKRLDDASKNKNAALLSDARVAHPESSKGAAGANKIDGHWGTEAVGFNWTEADSRDDRFGQMDVGPFLSTSLGPPLAPAAWHDPVYKAIVVRVGSKRQASISYDTELLRATAGWTGFLRFDPARFGIIGAPRPDGPITFVTPSLPGWSLKEEFPNFRADHRYGPLPKEAAHYEGLYRHGQRVVIEYTVGGTKNRQQTGEPGAVRPRVLDSPTRGLTAPGSPRDTLATTKSGTRILETPWLEETADIAALTRTLLIEPATVALKMLVADPKARVKLHARSESASVGAGHGGCSVLTVEPHDEPVTIKLLIASPDVNEAAFDNLVAASPAPEDVLALTKPGPTIWGEPLVTKGEVVDGRGLMVDVQSKGGPGSASNGQPTPLSSDPQSSSLNLQPPLPYVVDTITLPFKNPFNSLLFCGGHDFLPDGRVFVCTLHGDVWLVDGIDEKLERITWRRFATGLFQPLGVKVLSSSGHLSSRLGGERARVRGGEQPTTPEHTSSPLPSPPHSGEGTKANAPLFFPLAPEDGGEGKEEEPTGTTTSSLDSDIFVIGRDQITRLHDLNNDGEADYYENFNNDAHVTMNGHEYVACLEADRAGNLYYVKGNCNSATPHDGSLLRVSADGSKLDVFATGFRNPNGMSIGPNDEITVAPQEGEWTPASAVFDVREGGFYGMMQSHHQATPPTDFIRPICWFSRRDDNSCGGQVWTTSDRFGPLGNQLLHLSYGQCKLRLVLREATKEETGEPGAVRPRVPVPEEPGALRHPAHQDSLRPFNGGSFELPLTFASGIHRGRMNPKDGQLYLTGLKGWVSSAVNDGCFQRVRYVGATGQPQSGVLPSPPSSGERARVRGPNGEISSPREQSRSSTASKQPTADSPPKALLTLTLSPEDGGEGTRRAPTNVTQPSTLNSQPLPLAMQTYSNGVALTFSGPLDREATEDPSNYRLEAWNYKWSAEYGSPEYKPSAPGQVGRDEIDPKSATLLEDNRTVFIELPNLKPVDQLAVSYTLLTPDSKALEQTVTLTLSSIPDEAFPDSKLHRRPRLLPKGVTSESELEPGVEVTDSIGNTLPLGQRRMMAWTSQATVKWDVNYDSSGVWSPIKKRANGTYPEGGAAEAYRRSTREPLPPGSAKVIAKGFLRIPISGEYRFSCETDGQAFLTIDGESSILTGHPIASRLRKGLHAIEVLHYQHKRTGWLRLMWESDRFPREAVPATALFRSEQLRLEGSQTPSPEYVLPSDMGRRLYATHHCNRCHLERTREQDRTKLPVREKEKLLATSKLVSAAIEIDQRMPERRRQPPDLIDAGQRLEESWLRAWLHDPTRLRDHSTMPAIRSSNDEQQLSDLVAFLRWPQVPPPNQPQHPRQVRPTPPLDPHRPAVNDTHDRVEQGEKLFERLGCIACHRFSAPAEQNHWNRVSLHFLKSKYRPGGLEAFLTAPQQHHATSLMPDFHLTPAEVTALAAYLRRESRGEIPVVPNAPVGDAWRGRIAFEQLACQNCHAINQGQKLSEARQNSAFIASPTGGCLDEPRDESNAPRFAFTPEERHALISYLERTSRGHGTQVVYVRSDRTDVSRMMHQLRCNACHARDEARSLWPEIVAEEGSGRAVEAVPQLTWVGEKLQGPWIEKLLKGELDGERTRRMGFQPVRSALPEADSLPKRPDGLEAHPTGGNASHGNDSPTKARPWLTARMPSFPAYASLIAHGMAAEHGVAFEEPLPAKLDPKQVEIGRRLTLRDGGLDCRQCHGVGKEQPRGDASTQIALGINFALARERLRPEFALRQMLDPPRYDIGSRMPRFAPDLRTTAAKHIEGGDARKQFEALKQFLWSVNPEE